MGGHLRGKRIIISSIQVSGLDLKAGLVECRPMNSVCDLVGVIQVSSLIRQVAVWILILGESDPDDP